MGFWGKFMIWVQSCPPSLEMKRGVELLYWISTTMTWLFPEIAMLLVRTGYKSILLANVKACPSLTDLYRPFCPEAYMMEPSLLYLAKVMVELYEISDNGVV